MVIVYVSYNGGEQFKHRSAHIYSLCLPRDVYSFTKANACVLCVVAPLSCRENGTNTCFSWQLDVWRRPVSLVISCSHSSELLTNGSPCTS